MITISDIQQYGNLDLLAKKAVEGFITGLHKSPYNGFSVEFAEHKQYGFGDSIKNIDWKVYSRTDKLFTKRYEEETNLRCHILIDTSPSMKFPVETKGKLTFSLFATAALGHLLQKQKDAFGIHLFDDKINYSTEVKSTKTHLNNIITVLNQTLNEQPDTSSFTKTHLAQTITQIARTIHKRSLVVIFSDMFTNTDSSDELFKSLQHLKHGKHEVIVFHTLDTAQELELELENRPYEFTDLETGEKVKLNPSQIKSEYKKQMAAISHDLKLKCAQYKIDFIEVDVNKGVFPVLSSYLIKRKKMR